MDESNQKPSNSIGSLLGLLIIIVLMIIGGLYFWTERQNEESFPSDINATTTENTATSSSTKTNAAVSESLTN